MHLLLLEYPLLEFFSLLLCVFQGKPPFVVVFLATHHVLEENEEPFIYHLAIRVTR